MTVFAKIYLKASVRFLTDVKLSTSTLHDNIGANQDQYFYRNDGRLAGIGAILPTRKSAPTRSLKYRGEGPNEQYSRTGVHATSSYKICCAKQPFEGQVFYYTHIITSKARLCHSTNAKADDSTIGKTDDSANIEIADSANIAGIRYRLFCSQRRPNRLF